MGDALTKVGDYEVDGSKVLGEGGFGKVYIGRHIRKGHKVAIKQCRVETDGHGQSALQEIKHFQNIPQHKHIVKMYDYDYQRQSFWIVMEFCDLGDLEDYMGKYTLNIAGQVKIMHQCASAVYHLHSMDCPIIHRDIKPGNILFKRENDCDVVKLSDFGISRKSEKEEMVETTAGTQLFMPPEMVARQPYNVTVDTYALGLVYLAMLIYKPSDEYMIPISDTAIRSGKLLPLGMEMLQARLSGNPKPVVVSKDPRDGPQVKAIKELVCEMTCYDSEDRKPMKDVLKELEKIDGAAIKCAASTKSEFRHLFTSNLPAATPVKKPEPQERPQAIDEEEEESGEASGGSDGSSSSSSGVDLGYLLLRRMLESDVAERRTAEDTGFGRMIGMLPLLALMHLAGADDSDDPACKFEIGEKVVVIGDLARAQQLQEGHGGWNSSMEKYLDEEGSVKARVNGNRDVQVQFSDGKVLIFNAESVEKSKGTKASNLTAAKCKFKLRDLVKINIQESKLRALQKGHGGFNRKMSAAIGEKGIVQLILEKGDVYVEFFNGDSWALNPDALEAEDTSGARIEAGDLVCIVDDREKVVALQEDCGGWNADMGKCLGQSGVVRRMGGNGRAIVEIGTSHWCWSIKAIKLLAKSDELLRIVHRRQQQNE